MHNERAKRYKESLLMVFLKKKIICGSDFGPKMASHHNFGSTLKIFLKFCKIKGAERYMKIILMIWKTIYIKKKQKKNFVARFYGWGSTASRLETFRGGSLLLACKNKAKPYQCVSNHKAKFKQTFFIWPRGMLESTFKLKI